jgi:hypothetical protein
MAFNTPLVSVRVVPDAPVKDRRSEPVEFPVRKLVWDDVFETPVCGKCAVVPDAPVRGVRVIERVSLVPRRLF